MRMRRNGSNESRHRTWRNRRLPLRETERALLSRGELAFYRVLRYAIPRHLSLSLKTRLVDVVGCPDHLWRKPYGRRLAQKHVDFILFDPATGKVFAVLELDDRTHDRPERRRRDQFLDNLLAGVGIPLIRFRAASRYDLLELRQRIAGFIPS